MKRQIIDQKEGTSEGLLDIAANCLMMLSQAQNIIHPHKITSNEEQVFKCKTCNRDFSSFQALGGHRASHKRPKLDDEDDSNNDGEKEKQLRATHARDDLPKMHECSICGQRFSLGQALGGHMRKHRDAIHESSGLASMNNKVQVVDRVPVLKRSSSTRVMCLDLNLTPLENDLKLLFGTNAPKVNISF